MSTFILLIITSIFIYFGIILLYVGFIVMYSKPIYKNGEVVGLDYPRIWDIYVHRVGLFIAFCTFCLFTWQSINLYFKQVEFELERQSELRKEEIRRGIRTKEGHIIQCVGGLFYAVVPGFRENQHLPLMENGRHKSCD